MRITYLTDFKLFQLATCTLKYTAVALFLYFIFYLSTLNIYDWNAILN